jgi:hypothetical protein
MGVQAALICLRTRSVCALLVSQQLDQGRVGPAVAGLGHGTQVVNAILINQDFDQRDERAPVPVTAQRPQLVFTSLKDKPVHTTLTGSLYLGIAVNVVTMGGAVVRP